MPSFIVFHRFYGLDKGSVQACELEAWSWTGNTVGGGHKTFQEQPC